MLLVMKPLTERQKRALAPIIRALRALDRDGYLSANARMKPAVYLEPDDCFALLYEFDGLVR